MDWWTDKEAVLKEVCSKVEAAVSGCYEDMEEEPIMLYDSGFHTGAFAADNDVQQVEDPVVSEISSPLIQYRFTALASFPLSAESVASGLHDDIIKSYIAEVIEIEAPIKHDLLCKRVLRAIEISRMGPRMATHIQSLIDGMNLKTTEDIGPVYWKDSQDPQN